MEPKSPLKIFIEHFESARINYGDHINHSDIDSWCDFETRDYSTMANSEVEDFMKDRSIKRLGLVEGLKKYCLEEKQMYLQTVHGSGYKVARPGDQTQLSVEKGMKEIGKGMKTIKRGTEMINTALMTSSEREMNQTVRARTAGLAMLLGKKKDLLSIK
jgi:hypothetical protein